MMRSLNIGMAIVLMLVPLAGCSTGPTMATVNGTVTLDGTPLKEGTINFFPQAGDIPVVGTTITDGKFTAQVPVAKMRVEIHASKVVGQTKAYDTPDSPVVDQVVEIIPTMYNAESGLTIDIQRGSQEVTYGLKSKP